MNQLGAYHGKSGYARHREDRYGKEKGWQNIKRPIWDGLNQPSKSPMLFRANQALTHPQNDIFNILRVFLENCCYMMSPKYGVTVTSISVRNTDVGTSRKNRRLQNVGILQLTFPYWIIVVVMGVSI